MSETAAPQFFLRVVKPTGEVDKKYLCLVLIIEEEKLHSLFMVSPLDDLPSRANIIVGHNGKRKVLFPYNEIISPLLPEYDINFFLEGSIDEIIAKYQFRPVLGQSIKEKNGLRAFDPATFYSDRESNYAFFLIARSLTMPSKKPAS